MFVQDTLHEPKAVSDPKFPSTEFPFVFSVAVFAAVVLLAAGGQIPDTLWRFGFVQGFFAFIALHSIETGIRQMRAGNKSRIESTVSISPFST